MRHIASVHTGAPAPRPINVRRRASLGWWDWWSSSFNPTDDPDCEPMAYCIPAFQRILPELYPSALVARNVVPLRAVVFRSRIEMMVDRVVGVFHSGITHLYNQAITYLSDHVTAIYMFYALFPSRMVMSTLRLGFRMLRQNSHAPQHQ